MKNRRLLLLLRFVTRGAIEVLLYLFSAKNVSDRQGTLRALTRLPNFVRNAIHIVPYTDVTCSVYIRGCPKSLVEAKLAGNYGGLFHLPT